jgi:Leucine-rich repeat (LRR) protein
MAQQIGRHTLPAGEYEIQAQDQETGIVLSAKQFSIREGELTRLTASADVTTPPGESDWYEQVAAQPANEQVALVAEKLRELNPQFDAPLQPRILDQSVVALEINSDHLTDLTPLGVFTNLQKLVCRGSTPGKGSVESLDTLRRMTSLQVLDVSNNQVVDLLPLQGLKLQTLVVAANPIENLSALRSMPLELLDLNRTFVADLQPIQTLPLKQLDIRATQVRELWPLEDVTTLRIFDCYFRPKRDAATLRGMTFLRKLNGQSVEKFWQAVDARQKSIDQWFPKAMALPEDEKAQAVAEKLKELNPRFDGKTFPTYTEGKLNVIQFFTDNVTDIEPIRILTNLERLTIRGTAMGNGKLFDLEPLRELPIVFLECGFNDLSDLSALQGMKVQVLLCRGTRVRDVSPVRELPVFYFDCTSTAVADLSPLTGMGISNLHIRDTKIRDFSTLTKLNLRVLDADLDPKRDEALLKSLPRLELFNGTPITELWKQ